MAILEALIYPDPRLRSKCTKVVDFGSALRCMADDLLETMYHYNGCGLAAPQVGFEQRIFVLDLSNDASSPEIIVNPQILEASGSMSWNEACISFPHVWSKSKISSALTIQYQNIEGEPITEVISGSDTPLRCAAMQHETEHLDGKLFIDKLSRLKQARLLAKMEKALRIHGAKITRDET